MNLLVEIDREQDGRWIAEVPQLAGVMVYGETQAEAVRKARALAVQVVMDRREHGVSDACPGTASTDLDYGGGKA